MAHKSSIPEEISQYKPCNCCRIRNDNGTYRVYKYNAVKLSNGTAGVATGDILLER